MFSGKNANREVFHYWAHQTKPEMLRKGGRNYWFSGATFYSYDTPIARLMSNGVVLINNMRYSNTTAAHLVLVRGAVSHKETVGGLSAGDSHRDSEDMIHKENLHQFDRAYAQAVKELLTFPKRKITLGREIASVVDKRRAYEVAFDLKWPALDIKAVEDTMRAVAALDRERHEQFKQAEKERAAARARSQAENLERWRAGENPGCHFEVTALRLSKDRSEIETSRGAKVPVRVAPMLWKMALKCRANFVIYVPTNVEFKVGFYHLNKITNEGDLIIGCHSIPFEELVPIAAQLGLSENAEEASEA